MNDKWFNIAMIIVFTSFIANGFVFMLTAFPNGGIYGTNDFTSLHQNTLDYKSDSNSIGYKYGEVYDKNGKISPIASDTFNPIGFLIDGVLNPFGLAPLKILATAFVGLELLLLTLANIFPVFSVIFITIALVMFTVKAIVIAYFASQLIRAIFGGRT